MFKYPALRIPYYLTDIKIDLPKTLLKISGTEQRQQKMIFSGVVQRFSKDKTENGIILIYPDNCKSEILQKF
ncbi:hypothetical protein [Pedobacter borealis]|uniref:hypothetical protein n=1 Tax=Pedobacter borealis TaxID=475254 RepID=UPI000A7BE63F|nr:hypothetical protein [Pedobacter borealis]